MDTNTEVSGSPEPTELDPVANPIEANPSQATAAEGDGDQPQEQAEQQEAKPPKTFSQEEVDALIQKRLTKEARKHARELEQRLANLAQPKQQPKLVAQADEVTDDTKPPQQFTEAQVIEAAKKLAPQFAQQEREQQRNQEALEKFWERADELQDRFPDFDQAVRDPSFVELNGVVYRFAMRSEAGPEVAYHLSKNRAQARSIARMDDIDAVLALKTLESELKAKPKAQPSRAPDPINPVGNRGNASRSAMPSDDDDPDTWRQKELERMRKAGLIR